MRPTERPHLQGDVRRCPQMSGEGTSAGPLGGRNRRQSPVATGDSRLLGHLRASWQH